MGVKEKLSGWKCLAGEKAFNQTGEWMPQATMEAFKDYHIAIKGPLQPRLVVESEV